MDFRQVTHQEEEHGRPIRDGFVLLGRDFDGSLRFFSYCGLLSDVGTNSFRLLEPLDQLNILGDVALGVRQAIQNLVLELAHFYFKARLLLDEYFRHL